MKYELANRFTVAFLLVTVFLWGLAAVAFRHRDREEPRYLVVVLLAMSLWSLGDAIRLGAPDTAHILFWDRVSDTGIIFLAPAIFAFVASHTGNRRWLQRRYLGTLFLVSGGFFLIAATNPLHGLWAYVESVDPGVPPPAFVEGRGLLWYAFAIYGPALAAATYYLLFEKMAEDDRADIYRSQSLLIGIGILTPIFLTSFYLLEVLPYDPTPFGFVVSGVAFAVAIFRYDLFDVTPVARETVVETTSNGVLVVDRNGTVADANEAIAEVFDSDRRELVGQSVSELRTEYPRLLEPITDGHDSDETVTNEFDTSQTVTIRNGAQPRHFNVDVSPIQTTADAAAGRVAIFDDVTTTVERKNELLDRTDELERQNERLDRFASLISHDLRNPLQIAVTRLGMVDVTDDEDLDAVRDAHERMDEMIDDLLTMARAGQTIDETSSVVVADVVRESWRHADTGDADLEVEVPDDWTLEADADRLQHVFENLFRNAVEHNDSPPTVRVGTLDGAGATGFYVEDDGDGIPPAEREDVFEHGYTTSNAGTGFGLAIVTEVVDAHGWTVAVTESRDGGARFEVETCPDQPQ